MKKHAILLVLSLGFAQATSFSAPVRFDFDSVDPQPVGPTQAGWTSAPAGNGTDGVIEIETSGVGAITVDTRNRTGGVSDAGGGDEANMWNDFVFANGSFDSVPGSGLQITISGLAPDASFPITIWAFDDASPPSGGFERGTDWNVDTTLRFPDSPDPITLNDYHVTFTVTSDASGLATLTGLVAAIDPATSHNVFINGLEIGDPITDIDNDDLADSFEQLIIDADPTDAITTIADVLPSDDFDNDFSTNAEEQENTTDPIDPDSDNDLYLDGVEDNGGTWISAMATGTDPKDPDTDRDGLMDGAENPDIDYDANDPENKPGTDPNIVDTDGDNRSDGREIFVDGTDPTDIDDFFDPSADAIALFDFNAPGSATLTGWTAADLGNGTSGAISVATEAIGGITVDSRDRAAANGGGDEASLWQDFVFANGSFASAPDSGLKITLTGLQASTKYPITIWAFDSSSPGGRDADWSTAGGAITTLAFPNTPTPTTLGDYTITFEVESDATGTAVIDGIVAATNPDASHNVFINGLAVGSSSGAGIPFDITNISYDGDVVSITWNSDPDVSYPIYYSRDLKTWLELDDGFSSQGTSTTLEFSGPFPTPSNETRLYFRIER